MYGEVGTDLQHLFKPAVTNLCVHDIEMLGAFTPNATTTCSATLLHSKSMTTLHGVNAAL